MARERKKRARPARRREPTRRPGERIVEAILEGAERVLLEGGGVDEITTNRIAKVAGVSVGSLYQYFPNKEAIVAELAARVEARTVEEITRELATSGDAAFEDMTKSVARTVLRGHLGAPRLRRALYLDVPRRWLERAHAQTDEMVNTLTRAALTGRTGEIREGDVERMAFIMRHALEGVAEAAVRRHPEYLEDARFADELALMISRYLERR